jgi:hypothetical protein
VLASLDAGPLAAAVVLLGRPRPARKLLAGIGGTYLLITGLSDLPVSVRSEDPWSSSL